MNYWRYFDYCVRYYWPHYRIKGLLLAIIEVVRAWSEESEEKDRH
jgi:hypothetical protein